MPFAAPKQLPAQQIKLIQHTARWVARHGASFEDTIRRNNVRVNCAPAAAYCLHSAPCLCQHASTPGEPLRQSRASEAARAGVTATAARTSRGRARGTVGGWVCVHSVSSLL